MTFFLVLALLLFSFMRRFTASRKKQITNLITVTSLGSKDFYCTLTAVKKSIVVFFLCVCVLFIICPKCLLTTVWSLRIVVHVHV